MGKFKTIKDMISYTETFTATVGRRATKRYTDELALCLVDVQYKGVDIINHSWVECNTNFKGLKEGDKVTFRSTVIVYNKHSKDKKYGFSCPSLVSKIHT